MPLWSHRTPRVCLSVAVLVAAHASGAGPGAEATGPSLGAAVEKVCEKDPVNACDAMIKLAVNAGLSQKERARMAGLRLDSASQQLDARDTFKARRSIAQAVQLDRSASKPTASRRLKRILRQERDQLQVPDKKKELSPEDVVSAVVELAGAMKELRQDGQDTLANVVLDLAIRSMESLKPAQAPDQIRVALHLGILKVKKADIAGAKAEFRKALELDPKAILPHDTPDDTPKVIDTLEEVRKELSPPVTTTSPVTGVPPVTTTFPVTGPRFPPTPAPFVTKTWGYYAAGAGALAVIGGVAAGLYALDRNRAEIEASDAGDHPKYLARHEETLHWARTADVLYGIGIISGAGAGLLFWLAPGESPVRVTVGPGQASFVVNGRF